MAQQDRIHQRHCRFNLGYVCSCVTTPSVVSDLQPEASRTSMPTTPYQRIAEFLSRKGDSTVPIRKLMEDGHE